MYENESITANFDIRIYDFTHPVESYNIKLKFSYVSYKIILWYIILL